MITITNEAKQRIRSPIDLDFMAQRYQTENTYYSFTSPSLWTYDKNLYYLLKHSIEIDLETKYIRKPWLLAYDQYGNVTLEYLIMYINGIGSPEDFNIPSVVLPTMESIITMCSDKFSKVTNSEDLETVEW